MPAATRVPAQRRRCAHCHGSAARADCTTCGREMCVDCVSHDHNVGPVCGLCKDRSDAKVRWAASGSPLPFDEWYDQNG